MANAVPPVPHTQTLITKDGYLSAAWAAWFRELFNRVGGSVAPSNSDITTVQATVETHTTQITTIQNDFNQGRQL